MTARNSSAKLIAYTISANRLDLLTAMDCRQSHYPMNGRQPTKVVVMVCDLSALNDVGAAALNDLDEPLVPDYPHALTRRLPPHPLLLHQRRLARQRPARRQCPGLNAGAQDRGEL